MASSHQLPDTAQSRTRRNAGIAHHVAAGALSRSQAAEKEGGSAEAGGPASRACGQPSRQKHGRLPPHLSPHTLCVRPPHTASMNLLIDAFLILGYADARGCPVLCRWPGPHRARPPSRAVPCHSPPCPAPPRRSPPLLLKAREGSPLPARPPHPPTHAAMPSSGQGGISRHAVPRLNRRSAVQPPES